MSDAAELMDRMYRRQRHIYDLSRKFYLLGRDEAIAGLHAGPGVSVLEIGCGTGRNLVKLARAYPGAQLFGLDVSREMLASAAAAIGARRTFRARCAGPGGRHGVRSAALFGRARFDRVMISYALSMIPPWREALERALDVLAPGGSLHLVDFGDCAGLPGPFKAGLRRWLAAVRCDPARRSRRRARGALGRARPDVRDRELVSRLRRSGGRAARRSVKAWRPQPPNARDRVKIRSPTSPPTSVPLMRIYCRSLPTCSSRRLTSVAVSQWSTTAAI